VSLIGYAFSYNDRCVLENACEEREYAYCVSSLLKCKMHLYLRDFVKVHLHYATVEFEVQIYIYCALGDSLTSI
jgi:hypothetical protein